MTKTGSVRSRHPPHLDHALLPIGFAQPVYRDTACSGGVHEKIVPHQYADVIRCPSGLKKNQVAKPGRTWRNLLAKLHLLPCCAGDIDPVGIPHDDLDKKGAVNPAPRPTAQPVGCSFPLPEFLDEPGFGMCRLSGGTAGCCQESSKQQEQQQPMRNGPGVQCFKN